MKIICRCEDISEEEILELIREGFTTIDEIKRFSRAGMGHCQGRTCQRLIAQLISKETGKKVSEISYSRPRSPIKPVPLKVLANVQELQIK
ncbi:MAG: (2Fe-2S)-binding protein [bacterium]|nr:(2Fe-2S)-binding protein [bacterium]